MYQLGWGYLISDMAWAQNDVLLNSPIDLDVNVLGRNYSLGETKFLEDIIEVYFNYMILDSVSYLVYDCSFRFFFLGHRGRLVGSSQCLWTDWAGPRGIRGGKQPIAIVHPCHSKVLANERRVYMGNVFSHWLRLVSIFTRTLTLREDVTYVTHSLIGKGLLLEWTEIETGLYNTIPSINLFIPPASTKLKGGYTGIIIPPASTKLKGGYTGITLSVCPSVRLWTESCLLCIFNNTHRIHFIFAHLIKQLQKVCLV